MSAPMDLIAPITMVLQLPILLLLQTLPPELQDALTQLPAPLTPGGAGLYGGSVVVGVFVVRQLIKWRQPSSTPSDHSTASTGGGITVDASGRTGSRTTTRSGGGKHNVAFTLPSFLPVSEGIRHVTHNEIHALELGLVVGGAVTWLLSTGQTESATGMAVTFIAGSLGYRRYASKAFKTTRIEPWYALIAFAVGGGVGYWFFLV